MNADLLALLIGGAILLFPAAGAVFYGVLAVRGRDPVQRRFEQYCTRK